MISKARHFGWRRIVVSVTVVLGLACSCGSAQPARADDRALENWPSWRKDGSGVSLESELPQSWSSTENVIWKAPIPGKGNSSPIVWQDRVFLTTSVPGTAQHRFFRTAVALIWGLTLVALWSFVGGTLVHPLRVERTPGSTIGTAGFVIRKLLLIGVFIGSAYMVVERVGDEVKYAIPGGVLCALVTLVAGQVLSWIQRPAASAAIADVRPGLVRGVIQWLQSLCVLSAAGGFLVAVHSYLMADFLYRPTRSWFSCAIICAIGLAAFVGSIPRTPIARILGFVLAIAGLTAFAKAIPAAMLPLPQWDEHYLKYYLYVAGAAGLGCAWFCLEGFLGGRNSAGQPRSSGLRYAGATATLLLGAVFFLSMNFLLPKSVSMRQVVAVDGRDGKVLWQTTCSVEDDTDGLHVKNTYASPSAVTDGQHVYAHFGSVGAYCLDFDGREVWRHKDPVKQAHWGAGSSPILWKNLLLLTYDVDKRSFTLALDKATGKVVWEADRTSDVKPREAGLIDGYSTPIVVERNGQPELVNQSNGYLSGYDLTTGKELWHFENAGIQVIPTLVRWKDYIIVSGGDITKYLGAILIEGDSAAPTPTLVWEQTKNLSDVPSPVVYGDYLYMTTKYGIATCREADTGKTKWTKRFPGEYLASITAGDGKVYFTNTDGLTTVLAAQGKYEVLSENALEEPVLASLAVSRGHIYVRGRHHLYCIGAGADHRTVAVD